MSETIIYIMRIIGYIILTACLVVVAIKVLWNLGLPYAMMRENRKGIQRAWSVFPAIEIVPLLFAIGLAYVVSGAGVFSPGAVAIYGFAAIVASYLHFGLVALIHGTWRARCKNSVIEKTS